MSNVEIILVRWVVSSTPLHSAKYKKNYVKFLQLTERLSIMLGLYKYS